MTTDRYGVLKGHASAMALDDDRSPHIEIRVEAGGQSHRLAVNARSREHPHDLLYLRCDPFDHPVCTLLEMLPDGFTPGAGRLSLDYGRDGLARREAMRTAPFWRFGPGNDLRDFVGPLVRRAIADPTVTVCAFGEPWGPEAGRPDQYFGFDPGRGLHDIHMNQGSSGRFMSSNRARQDGALLFHLGGEKRWIAIFLAFQSQSWRTDPQTGDPL